MAGTLRATQGAQTGSDVHELRNQMKQSGAGGLGLSDLASKLLSPEAALRAFSCHMDEAGLHEKLASKDPTTRQQGIAEARQWAAEHGVNPKAANRAIFEHIRRAQESPASRSNFEHDGVCADGFPFASGGGAILKYFKSLPHNPLTPGLAQPGGVVDTVPGRAGTDNGRRGQPE